MPLPPHAPAAPARINSRAGRSISYTKQGRLSDGLVRVDSTGIEPALHACQQRPATITSRARVHTRAYYRTKKCLSQGIFLFDTRAGSQNTNRPLMHI